MATAVRDEDIDPELLEDDPTMRFCRPTLSQTRSGSSVPVNGDNSDDDGNETEIPTQITPPNQQENEFTNLASFGRLVKRSKKFSDIAEADFDLYCNTKDLEERLTLHYAVDLENRDLMRLLTKPENWSLSDDLKKNIQLYIKAFLLSPTVSSYKGNAAEHVLKAMRDLSVTALPSDNDIVQVKEVISSIGNALTTFRSHMKTRIKLSLDNNSKIHNIADLAHDLIGSTRISMTLQLYIRLAFLRYHVKEHPQPGVDTWKQVDTTLVKWRKRAQSERELSEFFNNMYQEDKATYGDPADSIHETIQPKNIPVWLKTIDTHACNVQGSSDGSGAKKRRLAE